MKKVRRSLSRRSSSIRRGLSFRSSKNATTDESAYMEAFNNFDLDQSGSIDAMELHIVMKSLGYSLTERHLKDMMAAVDTDKSGFVSYKEFLVMVRKADLQTDFEKEIQAAFDFFDSDGNGIITPSELEEIMKSLGSNLTNQEIALLIKEADANGDGVIDISEFIAVTYS